MQAFWGARSAGQILRLAVYEQNCAAARTAGWKSRTPNASKGIKPGAIATAPWAIIGRVPFTLAHAAAAYPLRRTRLVLSALIIGTFTPDLEFFLRFAPRGPFSHTPRGLFLFCLPVGFVVYWLFHAVVKEPLAAVLPRAARERVPADPYPLSLAPAVAVGARFGVHPGRSPDPSPVGRLHPHRPLARAPLAVPHAGPPASPAGRRASPHTSPVREFGLRLPGCLLLVPALGPNGAHSTRIGRKHRAAGAGTDRAHRNSRNRSRRGRYPISNRHGPCANSSWSRILAGRVRRHGQQPGVA